MMKGFSERDEIGDNFIKIEKMRQSMKELGYSEEEIEEACELEQQYFEGSTDEEVKKILGI